MTEHDSTLTPRQQTLRRACGISTTTWQLSDDDLWKMFKTLAPAGYKGFAEGCKTLGAEIAPLEAFHQMLDRLDLSIKRAEDAQLARLYEKGRLHD